MKVIKSQLRDLVKQFKDSTSKEKLKSYINDSITKFSTSPCEIDG